MEKRPTWRKAKSGCENLQHRVLGSGLGGGLPRGSSFDRELTRHQEHGGLYLVMRPH